MAGERYLTRDPERIRRWAEERGGRPVAALTTGREDDPGALGIDFPGHTGGELLEELGWDEWVERLHAADLVLHYQETTADGRTSRFHELLPADDSLVAAAAAEWVVSARSSPGGWGRSAPGRPPRSTRRRRRSPIRT